MLQKCPNWGQRRPSHSQSSEQGDVPTPLKLETQGLTHTCALTMTRCRGGTPANKVSQNSRKHSRLNGNRITALTLQEVGEEGQEFLIQEIMAPAPNGAEQGPQQQEVVVGLFGRLGELHRAVDNLVQVRLQDGEKAG